MRASTEDREKGAGCYNAWTKANPSEQHIEYKEMQHVKEEREQVEKDKIPTIWTVTLIGATTANV